MTTKADERKALEKIRKIVDEVGGKDSYIGMAFEGCFELAETNIENDWGCSMQQKIDQMSKSLETANDKYIKTATELSKIKSYAEAQERRVEEYKTMYETKDEDCTDLNGKLYRANQVLHESMDKISDMKQTIADNEYEIMQLKARLFDLLYANKETA